MVYKLIFADGTVLDDLTMSDNTFFSKTEIPTLTEEMLKEVKIIEMDESGVSFETVYKYARTNGAYHDANGWYLVIWGASQMEIDMIELREENEMLESAIVELAELIGG
jgi:hypothetical protein